MYKKANTHNSATWFKFIVAGNFLFLVVLLITACFLSVFEDYSFFQFNLELYGELLNEFRLIMVYLGITEIVVLAYCWLNKNFQLLIFVGFFMVLLIGSLQFYGEVNQVEFDENIPLLFLYAGLSHIVFGILQTLPTKQSNHFSS